MQNYQRWINEETRDHGTYLVNTDQHSATDGPLVQSEVAMKVPCLYGVATCDLCSAGITNKDENYPKLRLKILMAALGTRRGVRTTLASSTWARAWTRSSRWGIASV